MKRIAKIISITSQTDKETKVTSFAIVARVYPEMATLDVKFLPTLEIHQRGYAGVEYTGEAGESPYRFSLPKVGSFVVVEVNDTWTEFAFDGEYPFDATAEYREYERTLNLLASTGVSETVAEDLPEPSFTNLSKTLTVFHNDARNEFGFVKTDDKGNLIDFFIFNSNGSFTYMIGKGTDTEKSIVLDSTKGTFTMTGFDEVSVSGDGVTMFTPLYELAQDLLAHQHITPHGMSTTPVDSSKKPLSAKWTDEKLQELKSAKLAQETT